MTPFDPKSLIVPCGHCESCKAEKRLSWFIRLYYECLRCQDNGGFSVFLTLTYNNQSLPKLKFGDKVLCPVPSKRDIQLYLKRLRKSLGTFYAAHLKYFVVSEHGELGHRPHYHIIFFVDAPFNKWNFRLKIRQCWNHGFTYLGKNFGFVEGIGCFHYIADYCQKAFIEEDYFDKQAMSLRKHLSPFLDSDVIEKDFISRTKDFVLSSNNLGIYALEKTDINLLKEGYILMPDSSEVLKKYKLPLYLDRKKFYNVVHQLRKGKKQPIYVLTDEGCQMKICRYNKFRNALKERVEQFLQYPLSNPCLKAYNETFDTLQYRTHKDVVDSFLTAINGSLDNFLDWSIVYRGYGSLQYYPIDYLNTPLDDYINKFTRINERQPFTDSNGKFIGDSQYLEDYYVFYNSVTYFSETSDMEKATQLLDIFYRHQSMLDDIDRREKAFNKEHLKKYKNKNIYELSILDYKQQYCCYV